LQLGEFKQTETWANCKRKLSAAPGRAYDAFVVGRWLNKHLSKVFRPAKPEPIGVLLLREIKGIWFFYAMREIYRATFEISTDKQSSVPSDSKTDVDKVSLMACYSS
jgi:hypothetical protein